jgi:RHS repeat-associated protein
MRQLNALANSTSLVAFWGGRVGVSLSNGNTYTYDALGSMTSQTDARNCTTNLTYDLLNRPTQKSYSNCPSTSTVTYGYDSGTNGIGRRTSMTDGSGSAAWLYDSRGRVWKETKVISGSSFVTEWTYNSADLPITMKYPGGEIVTTTYDNNMLLKTVIGTATYVSNTQYDSASRMTSRALGNGLTQNYAYYPWNQQGGRLQTLAIGSLQNLTYAYDSVGNINTITDSINSQTQSFGYDALDRLTSASASGESWQGAYSETYSYDPATGNLQTKGGVTLAYGDANHVHAVTGGNSYQYDSNGSQITRTIGSDIFNLYYDAENRLVEVKKNSVTIAQFTFDGDGKRVKSVIGSETILFAGGHYEKKGSTITKYYFAGASRIAMRKYTVPQNMTLEYMIGDHLGSTSITTDNAGVKVSEMRYKAFGETRYTWTNAPSNTSPTYELTKYQFTGQYSYTAEFGLHFYGARFYDSATGRFVSADSILPQSQGTQAYDRYAYVNNNPLRYTDPTGHCPEEEQWCRDQLQALLPTEEDETLETYTYAGIETVSPSFLGIKINTRPSGNPFDTEGRAKLFPEEVEALGIDPQTDEGAFLGMQKRISDRIKACTGCSETDKFIVAALGSDYNFDVQEAGIASGTKDYTLKSGPVTINWQDYLNETQGSKQLSKDIDLISLFTSNVQKLQSQGYYVPGGPNGINFVYILNDLLPNLTP